MSDEPTLIDFLLVPALPEALSGGIQSMSVIDIVNKHDHIVSYLGKCVASKRTNDTDRLILTEFAHDVQSLCSKVETAGHDLKEAPGVDQYLSTWRHIQLTEQLRYFLVTQKLGVQIKSVRSKADFAKSLKKRMRFASDFNSIYNWHQHRVADTIDLYRNKWTTEYGPEKAQIYIERATNPPITASYISELKLKSADAWREGLPAEFEEKKVSYDHIVLKTTAEYITGIWTIYKVLQKLVLLFYEAQEDKDLVPLFRFTDTTSKLGGGKDDIFSVTARTDKEINSFPSKTSSNRTFVDLLVIPEVPEALAAVVWNFIGVSNKQRLIVMKLEQYLFFDYPNSYKHWLEVAASHEAGVGEEIPKGIESLIANAEKANESQAPGVDHYLARWRHIGSTEQPKFLLLTLKLSVQLNDARRKIRLVASRTEREWFASDFNSVHKWCMSNLKVVIKGCREAWKKDYGVEKAKAYFKCAIMPLQMIDICGLDLKDVKWKEKLLDLLKEKNISFDDDVLKVTMDFITDSWTFYKVREKLFHLFRRVKEDPALEKLELAGLDDFRKSKPGEDDTFSLSAIPAISDKDDDAVTTKRPTGDNGASAARGTKRVKN